MIEIFIAVVTILISFFVGLFVGVVLMVVLFLYYIYRAKGFRNFIDRTKQELDKYFGNPKDENVNLLNEYEDFDEEKAHEEYKKRMDFK